MVAHHPDQQRQRQRGADPEAPASCRRSSALGPSSRRDGLGLERHAADRAVAGADLLDLGMHRAGVDRRPPAPASVLAARPSGSPRARPRTCRAQRAEQKWKVRPPCSRRCCGGRRVDASCRRPGPGSSCACSGLGAGDNERSPTRHPPHPAPTARWGFQQLEGQAARQKKPPVARPQAARSACDAGGAADQPARSALIFGQLASPLAMLPGMSADHWVCTSLE